MCYHYNPSRATLSMGDLNSAKKQNLKLCDALTSIYDTTHDDRYASMAGRVRTCATYWQGFYCPTCHKYHYMHTTGCHHRLCAICAVRASRVVARQAMEAIEYIRQDDPSIKCSLLTLTQRNVSGDDLARQIDTMLAAWSALRHRREFARNVNGWARTIEIVPALHSDDYHPHIHAILIHHDDLGVCANGAWWARAWCTAMQLDYYPIVDIRPIADLQGAVYEVSKYVSKLSRVFDDTSRVVDNVRYIGDAMYNRQLRTYGGDWLRARRALNQLRVEQLDDDTISEYGDVTDLSGTCASCGTQLAAVCLAWAGLRYVHDDGGPMPHIDLDEVMGDV